MFVEPLELCGCRKAAEMRADLFVSQNKRYKERNGEIQARLAAPHRVRPTAFPLALAREPFSVSRHAITL